jgi:hypothetical protein
MIPSTCSGDRTVQQQIRQRGYRGWFSHSQHPGERRARTTDPVQHQRVRDERAEDDDGGDEPAQRHLTAAQPDG